VKSVLSETVNSMGHFSLVHGYITLSQIDTYITHNRNVIESLTTQERQGNISRDMFTLPVNGYGEDIAVFGQTYNGIERYWEEWLSQFENLLRELYWFEARVYLQTEFWGNYQYDWKLNTTGHDYEDIEHDLHYWENQDPLWFFSGGPRSQIRTRHQQS
jgi:hypothetical protein